MKKIPSNREIGFCNYSPFDIETMLPSGFMRLLPTSQNEKYVVDFVDEHSGHSTSYNFYFANYQFLVRQGVKVLDSTEEGGIDPLTTEKLAYFLLR